MAAPRLDPGVELPRGLDELHGPTAGTVRLPLRIYWSGPDADHVEWDLGSAPDRRWLYEIVLREGSLDDQRELINGAELVRVRDPASGEASVRQSFRRA